MFYCGFYSVDVAVAFLNHFWTVGRHGLNVCRIKTTIKHDINVSITPPFSTRVGVLSVFYQPLLAVTWETMKLGHCTTSRRALEGSVLQLNPLTNGLGF
jgi:hypothetical protein